MKLVEKSRIYMDLCVLERPYDDQRYYRIQLETAAVGLILTQVRLEEYSLYYSPVHDEEIANDRNEMRRKDVSLLLKSCAKYAKAFVKNNDQLERRGWDLRSMGLGIADAFHIAYAEQLGADFITCDDALLKKALRCRIKVWYGTPIDFCQKEKIR